VAEEVQPDFVFENDGAEFQNDGGDFIEGDAAPWQQGAVDGWPGPDGGYGPYPGGCGLFPCHWWWPENFSFFAGGQSFKGPVDRGLNGNFGFHEGFNWGGALFPYYDIGWQFGYQAVQSNFEGDQTLGTLSSETRSQHFITTGIFHRPLYRPFQWGVVFDWMRDEYYVDTSLSQIRAEFSLLGVFGNEIGFWGAFGTGSDDDLLVQTIQNQQVSSLVVLEPTDLFAFFLRHRFHQTGAEARIWGGFTGKSDGLIGADFRVPISPRFAIQGSSNYLASSETRDQGGQAEESWGVTVNFVWYPAKSATRITRSPYRPLFNVAEPSVFMVDVVSGP